MKCKNGGGWQVGGKESWKAMGGSGWGGGIRPNYGVQLPWKMAVKHPGLCKRLAFGSKRAVV